MTQVRGTAVAGTEAGTGNQRRRSWPPGRIADLVFSIVGLIAIAIALRFVLIAGALGGMGLAGCSTGVCTSATADVLSEFLLLGPIVVIGVAFGATIARLAFGRLAAWIPLAGFAAVLVIFVAGNSLMSTLVQAGHAGESWPVP